MVDSSQDKKVASPDIQVSHSVINYLNAGYQGKFAYLNILSQLNYPSLNPEEMGKARNALDRVNVWLADLGNGIPLFKAHWNYPDSHEAQKATELLEVLRDELKDLSSELLQIFTLPDLREESEEIKKLVAAYGRFAYSRDNYVRQIVSFGEEFELTDLIKGYKPLLPDIEEDIQLVHTLLSNMQAEEALDAQFYDALLQAVLILPGTFLTHVHDIAQLLAPYQGGLSFEYIGISEKEGNVWTKLNIPAVEAGYWKAHNFAPADAVEWKYAGFDHNTAAKWKVWGFAPSTAGPWFEKQFPLSYALVWSSSGYTVEETLELMRSGHMNPEDVPPNLMPERIRKSSSKFPGNN